MDKKQFVENQRAHHLYANTPLLKALLIVIIPGLLMTLMTGIYIFTSQIIIVRLLPIAHGTNGQDFLLMFGHTKTEIEGWCKDNGTLFFDVGDVVKGSMSISSPLLTIIGTSPFFLAGGAGVLFTQSLGKENRAKAREVYKTSFWMIAFYTIILIGILCALNRPILNAMSAKPTTTQNESLNTYYKKVTSEQVKLASDYTLVLTGGLILTMFTVFFASLIKSEGRFKLVATIGIVSNILSIGLVVIFIYVAKIGIAGGGLGNVVSFAAYLSVLLIYLIILNKRKDTWLTFNTILFNNGVKFNNRLIMPVVMVGLAAFLIDASYAIANGVYIPILANTAANNSVFPRAQGDGMYFQTIEGATMPTINLIFVTIYGIIEGERLIVAYNYSQGNWKRVKKTYALTMIIGFIYATLCSVVIAIGLNQYILKLFDIHNSVTFPRMLKDAELVFSIQIVMLPVFSLQAAAISIYMSIGDTTRSNISSIFQDTITFFPVLAITYGITMGMHNIWPLVCTYVISAFVSTLLLTWYTLWWLRKRFGRTCVKYRVNGDAKKLWTPINYPKQSYVQRALNTLI